MKNLLLFLLLPVYFSSGNAQNSSEKDTDKRHSDSLKPGGEESKVLDSRFIGHDSHWTSYDNGITQFIKEQYEAIKPLIFEKNNSHFQTAIHNGELSYQELLLFYLYSIKNSYRKNEFLTGQEHFDSLQHIHRKRNFTNGLFLRDHPSKAYTKRL